MTRTSAPTASRESGIAATNAVLADSTWRRIRSRIRRPSSTFSKLHPCGTTVCTETPSHGVWWACRSVVEGSKIVESAVELTLTDVKLNRLVDFLTAVEAGPGIVKVKYLRLEPRPAQETVTAWLTVATYKLK